MTVRKREEGKLDEGLKEGQQKGERKLKGRGVCQKEGRDERRGKGNEEGRKVRIGRRSKGRTKGREK